MYCLILYLGSHFFVYHKALGLCRQQVMNRVMKHYDPRPGSMGERRQPQVGEWITDWADLR